MALTNRLLAQDTRLAVIGAKQFGWVLNAFNQLRSAKNATAASRLA
jgi:hypothetical protein